MPTLPKLVGSAEAASILAISPTNFAHLRRNLAEAGDTEFPEPIQTLACGPIWRESDITKYKPKFESTRRRRRSSAEVAAERAAKEAAKAAEPQSDAEFEASAKKAPAKKVPAKKAAPKVAKSDGKDNVNAAAETTTAESNVKVPPPAKNGKVPTAKKTLAKAPAGKPKLALVKS